MLVASNKLRERNYAFSTEKHDGPFSCPECDCEVILKKGRVKIHHFAHKSAARCAYGAGESQKHLRTKLGIYKALVKRADCSECELEKRLDGVRPDVIFSVNNKRVVVEVQNSTIKVDDIHHRMNIYKSLGIYVIWVMPDKSPPTYFHKSKGADVCRMKMWERYVHGMQFGRLYYWLRGTVVVPYHFQPFRVWVEQRYDYGGHYRYPKTLRIPMRKHPIGIAGKFHATTRDSKRYADFSYPAAMMWLDKFDKWWEVPSEDWWNER